MKKLLTIILVLFTISAFSQRIGVIKSVTTQNVGLIGSVGWLYITAETFNMPQFKEHHRIQRMSAHVSIPIFELENSLIKGMVGFNAFTPMEREKSVYINPWKYHNRSLGIGTCFETHKITLLALYDLKEKTTRVGFLFTLR